MYKINLIGDINSNDGENSINYNYVLQELDNAQGQDLEVTINTLGGEVDEAFKIYNEFENYKVKNKAVITTITNEQCASSGVILLLAGNRRIVNNNSAPFVHNAMIRSKSESFLKADTLEYLVKDLREYDNRISELYSKKTSLSVDEALQLMNNNTSLTPEESYSLGFATELSKIYNRKITTAKMIIQNKLNNDMSEEKTFFEMAKNFFLGQKEIIQNKIVLTVADAEIDFYELDADATPIVGDKANIDGQQANGEYKTKDGKEYKFENGVITEIKEELEEEIEIVEVENNSAELETELATAKVEIENTTKENESLKLEIQNLKTELEQSKVKIEKFNKLESQFIAENKKEQRETKEVEIEERKTDWSALKNNLKNKK